MVLDLILPILVDLISDPIKQYIVTPVTRRIGYVFNCSSKVQTLQDGVEQLKNKKDRLQQSVDDATRNGEEIYPNVTTWLSSTDRAIGDAEQLLQQREEAKKKCLVGLCPNFKSRYQLSRKAVSKVSAIDKLRNEEGLDLISFRAPLQQIVEPSVYSREALPSRVLMLNQIMDALRDPNLNMIGVHGMGGVGKTTLTKEVQGKAVADKLFEAVIFVAVSQTTELRRIQAEIGDFLGLKFVAEELSGRASQLYKRLEKSNVLIILDDLWQKLDLNAIGIPFRDASKDFKIMLTSRNAYLLSREMHAQKLFSLEVLGEDETWRMFEMSVAEAKDPRLLAIATEVAKKCAGLPLLIQLVATELQNQDSHVWNDKLHQLSTFGDEEISERVYKVLESSYYDLPGEEIKSFFLLCALFGQSNIQIQYLLTHSMGLGLFKHNNIEGARDKVLTLIDKLKAKSLLLDGDMIGFIKMHDVVRDTALSIASRAQHAFIGSGEVRLSNGPNKDCSRISFPYSNVPELPVGLDCPEAELFLLRTENLCLEIPDLFFEGMNKLKVVDFTGMRLVSLPSSISVLTNLQTLCLHSCRLENVAMVGELVQLEALSIANSKIGELPREIEALTRLKLLDLTNCTDLRVIPENVLSKLCSLEELLILDSFVQWNAKGNACLVELDSLSHLSVLEIKIVNSKLIPQSCMFFHGLRSFKISIGDEWGHWGGHDERSRTLKLKLDAGIHLEEGVKLLLKGAEELYLSEGKGIESILYDLDQEGFPQLKHLHIENDFDIQHLIKSTRWASCVAFPILESLHLNTLLSLENICYGQLQMQSFGELRSIKISGCDKLKSLLSFSSTKFLAHLQEMEVRHCGNMEAVVDVGSEDEHNNNEVIEFLQLSSLKLEHLPNLTGFCKRKVGTAPMELLFNEMVSFPNLTSLEVSNCKSLKYVFAASMVEYLLQLKRLYISDCVLVEELIQSKKDAETEEESIKAIVFPNLDYLELEYLPNVKTFSCGYSIEFPLLRELEIVNCSAMKNFVSKFSSNESDEEYIFNEMVTFPNLEKLLLRDMNFQYLWDAELIRADDDSFSKLKSLYICDCSKLPVVFPCHEYRRFQRLEELHVSNCDGVEEIYQYQGKNMEAFSLRNLHLYNLPSLKNIWSHDPCGAFTFENLQSVYASSCTDLKYVFPASIACGLLQLQVLNIRHCENVEAIIAKEKDDRSALSFQFPELTMLELVYLKGMRSLYEGPHTFECPKLKSLLVLGVLNIFIDKFSGNVEELRIDEQGFNSIQQSSEFSAYKLKKLTLHHLTEESSIPVVFGFLRQLKCLEMLVFKSCSLEDILFESDNQKPTGEEQLRHLISLKHLELTQVSKLKHIIRKTDSTSIHILEHLHTLNVKRCFDLKNISASSSSASFQNLTTLCVECCEKMTNLVTASTAKTMVHLMELKVESCFKIEEIVTKDDGDDAEHDHVITFKKLKCLELVGLPRFKSFSSNSFTFNFPLLEQVTVRECHGMKTFCGGDLSTPNLREILFENEQQWEGNLNATIASQLREWVGEYVEEGRLFQNVESLQVVNDAFCSRAILASQMHFLNKLRKIVVRDCDSLQVVFDLEGHFDEGGLAWLLPQLDELNLVNLPVLTQLCNKAPKNILDFKKLEVLKIDNCSRLEYVFTWSMASCLFQLRKIKVKYCEMLQAIIKEEEGEGVTAQAIRIGSLESVIVECLPKFSSIYSGSGDLDCPSLKKISVRKCPSINSLISRVMREDKEGKDEHNLVRFSHKFIPNLEELELDEQSLTFIRKRGDFSYEFFSRLKKVTLKSFKEAPIPSLVGALRQLWSSETLDLSRCSLLQISVLDDEIEIKEEEHHHLRLKQLNLSYVENLKHMMKNGSLILNCILQNLQTLKVEYCHDLINIAPSSASFRNLTILKVENCEKMTSLVTASTAKTMVQLMELKVSNCAMMEEIVAFDADCIEHDGIIFYKLKILKLINLEALNSFCSGDYAFSFPFLEKVNVLKCCGMKFFCGGEVNTPNLRGMQYEDEQQWEGSLDATISFQLEKWVGGHFKEGRLFPNVETMELVKDAFCTKAILANQMHFLNKLRKIAIRDCESIQLIFDLEGLSAEDDHVRPLPQLDELHLINLPLLTQICNKAPRDILDFNNLEVLKIEKCSRLEYVFTWSMASCLFHLQKLHLKNCEMMESIIKEEEADKDALPVTLGSLESISVKCLPKFSSIYSGSGDLECPSLKKISVRECPTMISFVSKLMREDRQGTEEHNLIRFSHKVFPVLEELSLDIKFITAILQIELPTNFFSKVKNLKLGCCSATTKSYVPLAHFLSRLPNVGQLGVSNSSLKELFKFEGLSSNMEEAATQLPKITALNLQNLHSLKHMWGQNSQMLASIFRNLTSLFVCGCNQLSNLMTSSVAKSMVQLENLTVISCKMLMEIVGDRKNIATEEIVFSKMKTLVLVDLQSLGSFSLGCCTWEFPCLEEVFVSHCSNMRVFCPGNISTPVLNSVKDNWYSSQHPFWKGNLNSTIKHLYKEKVGFVHVQHVKLSIFPTLKENWGGQFPFDYFDSLERLVVDDCPIITNAIPSHLLEHLNFLKVLIVEKCELVEQVFDLEGLNATDDETKRMKYLNEMHLIDLPKLTNVWSKDPRQILTFKNLQLLKVHNCANLNYVFDFSMALNLPNLQILEVKNCSLVEHIIAEREENMQEYRTVFPSLQSMNLQQLTSLLSFYSASAFLECPSLKMIEVAECPYMELLASALSDQQDSCMIAEENDKLISNEILFLGNKIGIPGLEELKAEWNSLKGILYGDSQPEILNRLKHIELIGFQGDEYAVWPSNFLQRFPKLEKLALSDTLMEEINLEELRFPKGKDAQSLVLLTKLKLSNMSKLKHLVHDDFQLVPLFQILEDLEVVECSRLKILVPSTVSFQNLTNLEVSKCDGLINLMTASTARSLVQLRRMSVKDCEMMQEIVAIASDGVEYQIRFSQLEHLGLDGLPYLTSFCSGNCGFSFPSLKEVMVTGCPNMEVFSKQVPTTPKLRKVRTGTHEYDWEWEGSLNNTIEALFTEKSAEASSSLQIS